jgi:hypothetical protein
LISHNERAVILARGSALNFDLPGASKPLPAAPIAPDVPKPGLLTEAEMQRCERDNLLLVLEQNNWKIKGADGAAELLGVKPTTLLARMKKWGLKKHGIFLNRFDSAPPDKDPTHRATAQHAAAVTLRPKNGCAAPLIRGGVAGCR